MAIIFYFTKKKYFIKFEKKNNSKLIYDLENFFEKSYGFKVILFPSARAGIASILRFLKLIDQMKFL